MRATIDTDEKQRALAFAEKTGLLCEQLGLPRMAGRVVGWLLVCDPAHTSLVELAEVLQASKGSISTSTRLLEQFKVIERVTFPGDRRDYVRMISGAWEKMMNRFEQESRMMRDLAAEGLALLADAQPDRRGRLHEMHAIYEFLLEMSPLLESEWRKRQAEKRAGGNSNS